VATWDEPVCVCVCVCVCIEGDGGSKKNEKGHAFVSVRVHVGMMGEGGGEARDNENILHGKKRSEAPLHSVAS
jgi:hypothetical protein